MIKYKTQGTFGKPFHNNSETDTLEFNFFPISLDTPKIKIYKTPYIDKDSFFRVKNSLPSTWLCRRNAKNASYIYLWPTEKFTSLNLDNLQEEEISLNSEPEFACSVISEGLKKYVIKKGFKEIWDKQSSSFVDFKSGNLMNQVGYGVDKRVGIYPEYKIDTFFTSFKADSLIFGFVIDVSLFSCIDVPVSELIEKGMDCRGCYVKVSTQISEDAPLYRYRGRTIGEVKEIKEGKIILSDFKDPSLQTINSELCTIEPSKVNLNKYLEAIHPQNSSQIKFALKNALDKFNSPKEKYNSINLFKNLFGNNDHSSPIMLSDNLSFSFSQKYQPRIDSAAFRFRRLNSPKFNHDYSSSKISSWADKGLRENGPYDKDSFANKKVNVLFVSPDIHKGDVEKFIKKFQGGINNNGDNVFNGFDKKYALREVKYEDKYFPMKKISLVENYESSLVEILKENQDINLCFLVIQDEFKKLAIAKNPYFVCKALLLSQGIPVQEVTVEKMRMPDYSLQYICNNMALASYAKMGGIPFVLRADELIRKELVIGIGSALVKDTRLSKAENIIGFTTIFKNNGDFRLNSCTPCVKFDNYVKALEDNVAEGIERVTEQEGYSEGDELRIIFHVYKKTGKKENLAIEQALKRLSKYKIEFALVHINDSHNFKIFDCTNSQNQDPLIDLIPPRGVSIELGPRERLINFVGPKQYKKRGCPTPLKITLDSASTFKDLEYLTQQIYDFSFISWRGFLPAIQPVTIFYSSLIAGLNGRLSKIPNWNQNMIRTKLYDKMWFL